MITYQEEVTKYYSDQQTKDKLISTIESKNYYSPYEVDEDYLREIIIDLNDYLNGFKSESHIETLKRHETEEEARAYFGEDFIKEYDKLLTRLNREQTVVSIHGTSEEKCEDICNEGLDAKMQELRSTAEQQRLPYGTDENIHFDNYESLLNWGHHDYKGLVIVAVPYECFYKEGLWKDKELAEKYIGDLEYRLNPDFIAGYMNVTEKKLVLNPKYNRNHDYTGLKKDLYFYKKRDVSNNEEFLKKYKIDIDINEDDYFDPEKMEYEDDEPDLDFQYLSSKIQGILIDANKSDEINQKEYKNLLRNNSRSIEYIKKYIDKMQAEKSEASTDDWSIPQEIGDTTYDPSIFENLENPFSNNSDEKDEDTSSVNFM